MDYPTSPTPYSCSESLAQEIKDRTFVYRKERNNLIKDYETLIAKKNSVIEELKEENKYLVTAIKKLSGELLHYKQQE